MVHQSWFDNRCLVPNSHKDPTKWKNYEMHGYRKAFNKKQLNTVDQFKYDDNFFNWVDPKVLKYFYKEQKKPATSLEDDLWISLCLTVNLLLLN